MRPRKKIGISTTIMRCSNCGLIYSNPQPVPDRLLDHYGVTPENYWKEEYFDVPANHFAEELLIFNELLDTSDTRQKRVLDVGAGIGKTMTVLAKAGFDAYGIEPSTPFYEYAVKKMNISPDKLQNVSIEEAEFPPEFFDIISFGIVLEHIYDPNKALKKVLSWLRPGGIIHVEVPSADYLISKIMNGYFRLRGTDFVVNCSPMHTPFHLYEFTPKSFIENGSRNNYELAKVVRYTGNVEIAQGLIEILKPLMQVTQTGMGLVVYLRKIAIKMNKDF